MNHRIQEALKTLGISPPVSIKELKETYRRLAKEEPHRISELSQSYRFLINIMESYPFSFSQQELNKLFPEERIRSRFEHILWNKK